jgi:hypothetical protein
MSILRQDLVDYLRASLTLQDPAVETDSAYVFTDETLQSILANALLAISPTSTLVTMSKEIEYPLMLLGKKEVYWRLATSSAQYYPLTVEGVSITKNVRFDHYIGLIKQVDAEYKNYLASGKGAIITSSDVGEIILPSRHFSRRNYELYQAQVLTLSADNIYANMVELSWTKFNRTIGQFFAYLLYLSTSPIVDNYSQDKLSDEKLIATLRDIHNTKYRISNLTPATKYYVAVGAKDSNEIVGYSEISFTTLTTQ